jgi:YHS domain-containing protein
MGRIVRTGAVVASLSLAVILGARGLSAAPADEPVGREIPPAFAPLEYLVGEWNGAAMPKNSSQSFRGWIESHTWAWTFAKGKPTGLTVAIQGGKVLADGKLTFDPDRKRYRLEGTAPKPRGGPVAFEGALDTTGKLLVLDQVDPAKDAGDGPIRLSLRPNSNFIRYTMWVDRKGPGALPFYRATEIGVTRKGESLTGGATDFDTASKCIVTGGKATMSITYQGQTFPLCCTGCRDEFKENPEKYIKKASLLAQSRGKAKAAPAQVSRFEDAFAGDVADSPSMKASGRSATGSPAKSEPDEETGAGKAANPEPAAAKKAESKSATSTPAARGDSLLRIGQNLEKSGKTDAALASYKRIVKDFAETPAAGTAKERIKALERR